MDIVKEEKKDAKWKEVVSSAIKKLFEVDEPLIKKLYIVQIASVEGWRFANSVDFYQSGKHNLNSIATRCFSTRNFFSNNLRNYRKCCLLKSTREERQREKEVRLWKIQSLQYKPERR